MIHRRFREPNFRCRVHDKDGKHFDWLAYAESEIELRQHFENCYYIVDTIKPYDFAEWQARATKEAKKTVDAHDRGESPTFNSRIWSQLKHHLFEIFSGKCAYCEADVDGRSGRVDHFRPKQGVHGESHPGYYWLAYDVDNLLPCCVPCNEPPGKHDHFPIAGKRAYSQGDPLDAEAPLILNPYRDHPEDHLAFVPGITTAGREITFVGMVEGISEAGKKTVEICGLKRSGLIEGRRKEQEHFVHELSQAMNEFKIDRVVAIWCDVLTGVRPYSASIMAQRKVLEQLGIFCPPAAQELVKATY